MSLCHLSDLVDALHKVRLLTLNHCRDVCGGIRCGAAEEILCRFLGDH